MSLLFEDPLPDGTQRIDTPGEVLAAIVPAPPMPQMSGIRARRIPNIGHALLFVGFTLVLIRLLGMGLGILAGVVPASHGDTAASHPKLQLAVQGLAYLAALGAAWLYFPLVWLQGFLSGVRWNWSGARLHAGRLLSGGLMLGLAAAAASYFISPPKDKLGIDQFFGSTLDAWLVTFFGIFIAPVFEEICFRGFLLPAFAIAIEWVRLPRNEQARAQWETTTTLTPQALLLSGVLTSVLFAMMHFQQDAHLWSVMALLFCVSLLLTAVRIVTDSVAASVMVHAAYNSFNLIALMLATGGFRHLDRMTR